MAKHRPRHGAGLQRPAPRDEAADARKVDDVEQGLAALPKVLEEVVEEVPPEDPEAAAVTATRLKHLFDRVKQQGEIY